MDNYKSNIDSELEDSGSNEVMNQDRKYSVLVNSCDAYEDCWNPFFKLFLTYWPNFNDKILLNTEKKIYTHKGINIVCVKSDENIPTLSNKILPWGERFKKAIEKIDTEIVLYLQEDYFFKDYVQEKIIDDYYDLMANNKDIDCIHLTDQSVLKKENSSLKYGNLYPVKINQRYRLSLQAALWRKDVLLEYIRSYESIWDFEEFGSKRASILKHNFYLVNPEWVKLNQFEIIPYVFTGITGGRWNEEVVALFDKHDIRMDYSLRGFIKEAPVYNLYDKIINKWRRIPMLLKNYSDLKSLKSMKNENFKK